MYTSYVDGGRREYKNRTKFIVAFNQLAHSLVKGNLKHKARLIWNRWFEAICVVLESGKQMYPIPHRPLVNFCD